jgi:hypothetical protein
VFEDYHYHSFIIFYNRYRTCIHPCFSQAFSEFLEEGPVHEWRFAKISYTHKSNFWREPLYVYLNESLSVNVYSTFMSMIEEACEKRSLLNNVHWMQEGF